jgi:hypothetical protein
MNVPRAQEADMSRDLSMRRWATGVLAVAALLAAGCGSGAVEGPDEEADDDAAQDGDATDEPDGGGGDGGDGGGGGGDGGDGDGEGDRYSWSLPIGDVTPDDTVNVYLALRSGCEEGESEVNREAAKEGTFLQGEVLQLYRAAIAVCRGDVEGGRALFAGAGTGGYRSACLVRQAIISVLEQRPQDTDACPDPNTTTSTEETTTTEGETTTTTEGETTTTSTGGGDTTTTEGT